MEVDVLSINKGFSKQAPAFDEEDASNPILQWMRSRVRRHVLQHLTPNSKILEINAGTGLDAVYFASQHHRVHASDLSEGMIAQIRKKILAHDLRGRLSVQQISYRHLDQIENAPFDFIFSNFSGLNCIQDLREVSQHMDHVLNPGGHLTFVIMPRVCPWEIGLVFKGNFHRAFRRFKKGGDLAHLEGERFMTYYFSPADVQQAFGQDFEMVALEGLGCFCPPPHKKNFARQYPKIFQVLTRSDEMLSRVQPFDRWADHFIITLRYAPKATSMPGKMFSEGSSSDIRRPLHDTLPYTISTRQAGAGFFFLKKIFDLAFSLLFTVLILWWLIPLLALLIKIDSKGPVFFLQKRTGHNGKEFYCIKLRTMRVNEDSDSKQASHQDSRITRFGYFLRNANLDELPQFVNVLKGDMSVIGPRPHMVYHTDRFAENIKHYHRRHEVKPGITGLAQIMGWRGPTPTFRSIHKRVQWDIFYVTHQSVKLDIFIFVSTFKVVLTNLWKQLFS